MSEHDTQLPVHKALTCRSLHLHRSAGNEWSTFPGKGDSGLVSMQSSCEMTLCVSGGEPVQELSDSEAQSSEDESLRSPGVVSVATETQRLEGSRQAHSLSPCAVQLRPECGAQFGPVWIETWTNQEARAGGDWKLCCTGTATGKTTRRRAEPGSSAGCHCSPRIALRGSRLAYLAFPALDQKQVLKSSC